MNTAELYLDYFNNFLTPAAFGEHYGIEDYDRVLAEGRNEHQLSVPELPTPISLCQARKFYDIDINADVLTIGHVAFVSCDALVSGDYGGAGAAGVANIRTLMKGQHDPAGAYFSDIAVHSGRYVFKDLAFSEYMAGGWKFRPDRVRETQEAEVLHMTGSFYSQQVWVRADSDLADEVYSLLDYPVLDEFTLYEVEAEWREAHILDSRREIGDHIETWYDGEEAEAQEACEHVEAMPDPEFLDFVYGVIGDAEFAYEYSSAYLDFSKFGEKLADAAKACIKIST